MPQERAAKGKEHKNALRSGHPVSSAHTQPVFYDVEDTMFFTPRALAIINDRRVCRLPTIIRCQNPRFEFELMILSRAFPLPIVFHSSSLRRVMRRSSITNTSLFGHVDHRRYAMELEVVELCQIAFSRNDSPIIIDN